MLQPHQNIPVKTDNYSVLYPQIDSFWEKVEVFMKKLLKTRFWAFESMKKIRLSEVPKEVRQTLRRLD